MTTDADLYAECMDHALERLWEVGFEFGPDFAVHAPMVAETLATLGHRDTVPSWIKINTRRRQYYAPPSAVEALPEDADAARQAALGDYRRVTDWTQYFDRRLAERPWREVLVDWWPQLMEGAFSAFTHGLIRTAHAVRALTVAPEPSTLQLNELARGLAYWAARYRTVPWKLKYAGPAVTSAEEVPAALTELTALNAGKYAEVAPDPAVPQVHSITAPAALRLVLPILPPELAVRSFEAVAHLTAGVWTAIPSTSGHSPASAEDYRPPSGELLVADAVELGEEHAIKLTEACLREHAVRPDDRYLAAAHTLITKLKY